MVVRFCTAQICTAQIVVPARHRICTARIAAPGKSQMLTPKKPHPCEVRLFVRLKVNALLYCIAGFNAINAMDILKAQIRIEFINA